MKIRLSKSFYPLLDEKSRYLVLCGGRGSGKSEFAARKILYRCLTEGNHRFLILRKVRKTLQESCIKVMRTLLAENDIVNDYNKTDRTIVFYNHKGQRNEILFDGLDEREKIKSYKAATSGWLEELTEFTKDDFIEINLILREPTPFYKQLMMSFNPDEARAPWIKEMFFDNKYPETYVHKSTVRDNPVKEVREQYLKILEQLDDETYRDIYLLGEWAFAKGQIYNWSVDDLPGKEFKFDEIFYGGDFGYSVNPSTVIRIYKKGLHFWVQEIVYEPGLTNQALGRKMISEGITSRDSCYFDSAEPKSIQELCNMGLNIIPSMKGPDSVRAGIDYLRSVKITIVTGSENIVKERSKYKWKVDKNGIPLNEPVKIDDHAMDAIRYGIYTHLFGHEKAYFSVAERSMLR